MRYRKELLPRGKGSFYFYSYFCLPILLLLA